MQQDFTNLFSKSTLLSSPKLILSLDDSLTLPTAVLHASLAPTTAFPEFLDMLKAVPLFLLSKDSERLASTAFSNITHCVVYGVVQAELESVIDKAVPFKGDISIENRGEAGILIKAENKDALAKAVAAIKEKLKPEKIHFLTSSEISALKIEQKLDDPNAAPKIEKSAKTPLKQYSVIELLKIYTSLDPEKQPPRLPRNLGWYEKEALEVVLRPNPISTLAIYQPATFGVKFDYYGGYRRNYQDNGYIGTRRKFNRYGYRGTHYR